MNEYYTDAQGEAYLAQRQGATSERVQALRASLFKDVSSPQLSIVDFGCGTGGIISMLPAKYRVGIEVSTIAARIAMDKGIDVVTDSRNLPRGSFDLAISFHAIEHVDRPLDILSEIGALVKPGGHIRLVVPCETPLSKQHHQWTENNHRHLHTWTPLIFGNLAQRAGYREIQTRIAPMPTGSRIVRWLSFMPTVAKAVHMGLSIKKNQLNVILDARPPKQT